MAVKLSVMDSESRYLRDWWINFCLSEVKLSDTVQHYEHPLSKWGGKLIPGKCIEFENDAAATAFLLRWS